MVIANLKEMLKNENGIEYDHKGHKWINENLSCGCRIAVCVDIEPSREDYDLVSRKFTKINTLKAIINETLSSNDEEIKKRFSEFQKEIEEVQSELTDFILKKRKEYNFPNSTDCNGEYYYIKIQKGSTCKN